jgi:hypothetical protein
MAHYSNGSNATALKHRLRGRVADKIARDHGYQGGYKVVSLVEMDFASDEQKYLESVIFGEHSQK